MSMTTLHEYREQLQKLEAEAGEGTVGAAWVQRSLSVLAHGKREGIFCGQTIQALMEYGRGFDTTATVTLPTSKNIAEGSAVIQHALNDVMRQIEH